jgi:hypothetical protein
MIDKITIFSHKYLLTWVRFYFDERRSISPNPLFMPIDHDIIVEDKALGIEGSG